MVFGGTGEFEGIPGPFGSACNDMERRSTFENVFEFFALISSNKSLFSHGVLSLNVFDVSHNGQRQNTAYALLDVSSFSTIFCALLFLNN